MQNIPQIALFFTAVFALISIPMSILVGVRRAQTGILLLHGDDDILLRRMRAHANFTEHVPLAVLALAGAELTGVAPVLLLSCGTLLLAGRLIHFFGLNASADSKGRALGAGLTTLSTLVLSLAILWQLAFAS